MSGIIRMTVAGGLVAVLAGPAVAGEENPQTLMRDSRSYVSEAGMAGWTLQPNAHTPPRPRHGRMPAAVSGTHDFQLDGR